VFFVAKGYKSLPQGSDPYNAAWLEDADNNLI